MSANNGGPAFPTGERLDRNGQVEQYHVSGMTLRDWFAGMALQGLMASGHFTEGFEDNGGAWMTTHEDPYDDETGEKIHKGRQRFDFPEAAWRCADEMLRFRDGKEDA